MAKRTQWPIFKKGNGVPRMTGLSRSPFPQPTPAIIMTIRVLIADDHRGFRNALRCLLEIDPDLDVIGEASSGQEACRMAIKLLPHVVCIDFRMSQMDGVESIRRLNAALPDLKIIGLSASDESDTEAEMLAAGASMFVHKQRAADDLRAAIHALFALVEEA
jgi:DNA-binding NarL/FixJ family response regulator